MRIAYIECFSGISGDMFLGALVDAGVPASLLHETTRALNLGAELQISKVDRSGITSTKVDVVINGEPDRPREAAQPAHHVHSDQHGHSHSHEHRHEDGTVHAHPHAHDEENQTQDPATANRQQPADSSLRMAGSEGGTVHAHPHAHDEENQTQDPSTANRQQSADSSLRMTRGESGTVHAHPHAHDEENQTQDPATANRQRSVDSSLRMTRGESGTVHAHPHAHDEENQTQDPATANRQQAADSSLRMTRNEEHGHGRHLSEIKKIIAESTISARAKQTATAIFETLGAAEAKIHNVPVETIHFHEVGAVDAIIDIVCGAVGAEALNVERFVCSPLNVGGGTVVCTHGTFPVPAPATVELLKGAPVFSGEIQKELVTPTGAAIVKTLAHSFGPMPAMTIGQTGYGAGSRNFRRHANVLRITVGESAAVRESRQELPLDEVTVLEANIDDLNPQLFGYVAEQALAAGALDVFATPVQMKKGRPGTLITLLAKPENAETIAHLVFRETSTIGIRTRREQRFVLPRRHEAVLTQWGEIRMKIAQMNGSVSNYAPEYEDCRRIAEQNGVPLKAVMQEAIRLYLEIHPSHTHV